MQAVRADRHVLGARDRATLGAAVGPPPVDAPRLALRLHEPTRGRCGFGNRIGAAGRDALMTPTSTSSARISVARYQRVGWGAAGSEELPEHSTPLENAAQKRGRPSRESMGFAPDHSGNYGASGRTGPAGVTSWCHRRSSGELQMRKLSCPSRDAIWVAVVGLSVLALGASPAIAKQSHGKEFQVDDDRKQCRKADFTSIQAAVTAAGARPGRDRIEVCPGLYQEQVRIEGPAQDGLKLEAQRRTRSLIAT